MTSLAAASISDAPESREISRRSTDHAPPTGRKWRARAPLGALLLGTALLYLIGLSRSGWANQFYAAAAQAGSKSWKAFLFGSLDQSNFITVDKPPASLWVMDLSVRLFGVNSWAILVPQALEGVAAVAVLYLAVKRVAGRTAGLLAGAALALTPVATLMFRFDNPDALLVLLISGAAYATVRAVEAARMRWLALAGVLLGFAFLTKMLQGLIVVPAFALAYLVAAPTSLRRRLLHVLGAGAAMFAAAGWWVALVELWPAGSRPYIGGSTNNSVLQLVFGYNGIGRLTGADNNGVPVSNGGGAGGFSSGSTGVVRLFGTDMGTQISWLLPAALIALVALGWHTARRPRTDVLRASIVVWGGWLLLTGVVFSYASGIIHPYYTVALAPAIAALVGLGVTTLWRERHVLWARWTFAGLVAVTAAWTYVLLGRASWWQPELRWLVVVAGVLAVATVLAWPRAKAAVVASLVAVTLLAAPAAYSLQTASTAHTGALPVAGPSSGFGGFGGFGGLGGGPGRGGPGGFPGGGGFRGGTPPAGQGTLPGAFGAQGGTGGTGGSAGQGGTGGLGRGGLGGGRLGAGGLGGGGTVSSALTKALQQGSYTWAAATTSDNEAASLELASGKAVMSLGGFNGTDNAITLAQFKQLVAQGKVHYYVSDGQGFIGSTSANTSTAYAIGQWVQSTYTATTIGNTTVYDLTSSP
jgi:4-amino-4-deoxy-L-arabinose transferase-like glycosyltransferase